MAANCFTSFFFFFDLRILKRPKLWHLSLDIFSCLSAGLAFIVSKSHDATCSVITFVVLVNHILVKHIDRYLLQVGWLAVSLPHCPRRSSLFLDLKTK